MSQISRGDPTRNGFIGQSEPASTFRPPHVKFFKQRPPVEHRPLPALRHPAAEIRHVHALLRVENLAHRLWEPAAGRGAIVNVLRAAGHDVLASDLVDYGVPGQASARDFLMERRADVDAIVTNPPFKSAEEFVARALDLCPRVIMLLRLAFLESDRRRHILENRGLARVHVFRKRLPMMHRDGWEGRKANSGMAFAWFVWNRAHAGPATINRVSWETAQ